MKKLLSILMGIIGILTLPGCDDGTEVYVPDYSKFPLNCKDHLCIEITDDSGRNLLYSIANGDKPIEGGLSLDSMYVERDNGITYIPGVPYEDITVRPTIPENCEYEGDTFFRVYWVKFQQKVNNIVLRLAPFPSRQYSCDLVFADRNKRIHISVDYKSHFTEFSANYDRKMWIESNDIISWNHWNNSIGYSESIGIVMK